jgi:hypothetical protein
MIAIVLCAVLFIWAAVDWFLASMKLSWLWVITPFAWVVLAVGCVILADQAAYSVIDRPLPADGSLYIFPMAVVAAAAGMVLNSLEFWSSALGQLWARFH